MSPVLLHSEASEIEQSSLVDVKAIFLPSGDHDGKPSEAGESVRRLSLVPSAFITKPCSTPPPGSSRSEFQAILEPSGNQAGPQSTDPALRVRLVVSEPSALAR